MKTSNRRRPNEIGERGDKDSLAKERQSTISRHHVGSSSRTLSMANAQDSQLHQRTLSGQPNTNKGTTFEELPMSCVPETGCQGGFPSVKFSKDFKGWEKVFLHPECMESNNGELKGTVTRPFHRLRRTNLCQVTPSKGKG